MSRTRHILGRLVGAAVILLATMVVTAPEASAQAAYEIRNQHSGKCLTGENYRRNAVQLPCTAHRRQGWQTVWAGNGWYQIRSVAFVNYCLASQGTANAAPAALHPCNAQWIDQLWAIDQVPNSRHDKIRNRNTGRCLTIQGYQDYAPATVHDCGPWIDQEWLLT